MRRAAGGNSGGWGGTGICGRGGEGEGNCRNSALRSGHVGGARSPRRARIGRVLRKGERTRRCFILPGRGEEGARGTGNAERPPRLGARAGNEKKGEEWEPKEPTLRSETNPSPAPRRDRYGQLGHGDDADRIIPRPVEGIRGPARSVSAGFYHTVAVAASGSVFTWGDGRDGKLGHGDDAARPLPTLLGFFVEQVGARESAFSGLRCTRRRGHTATNVRPFLGRAVPRPNGSVVSCSAQHFLPPPFVTRDGGGALPAG